MGNACKRCFGIHGDSRKFIRAKYTMTKDFSIEFENLVEEDVAEEIVRPVSEHEKRLVKKGKLFQLVAEQAKKDLAIDEQLAAQEEALKIEEEAFYAERRAAAAHARRNRHRPLPLAAVDCDPLSALPGRGDWSDVELDEDDLDLKITPLGGGSKVAPMPLSPPSVAASRLRNEEEEEWLRRSSTGTAPHNRSLHQRLNQGYCSDTEIELGFYDLRRFPSAEFSSCSTVKEGFGDFQSVSSGREASIDLDWDHEPGMNPQLAEGMERSATEEDLTRLAHIKSVPSPPCCPNVQPDHEPAGPPLPRPDSPESLVWEHDYAMDVSRRHLLAEEET